MGIDKNKAARVSKPFVKEEEKGWLESAVDGVKEFFAPTGPSYEEKVSQGLKDFKDLKTLPMPTQTPTPTPTPQPTPMGDLSNERHQKVLAKQYFLSSLGLTYTPTQADYDMEEEAENKSNDFLVVSQEKDPEDEEDDYIAFEDLVV